MINLVEVIFVSSASNRYPTLLFEIFSIRELNFTANQNEQKNYFIGWEKKYLDQHEDLKNFIIKSQPIKAKNKMIQIISENK